MPLAGKWGGYSPEQVLIGETSCLVSAKNPSGVGVYNSTEGSLDRGISLAKQMGVDPSTKGMAGGFIPNFDVQSSFLMGMVQGSFTDLTKKLDFLSVGYDKEIEARRKLAESYTQAQFQIATGKNVELAFGGGQSKVVSTKEELERTFKDAYLRRPEQAHKYQYLFNKEAGTEETAKYDEYYQKKQATQQKLGDLGFKGMFAGPMIGEAIASAFKTAGMENVSKAFSELSSGITTASQMLNLLPNQLGKALAVGEMFTSLGNAISVVASKLGTYEKRLDLQNTLLEKLSSSSNTVLDSYSKLNQLYSDSSSSTQDYFVQQNRLAKALSDLASIAGGPELVQKLRSAALENERTSVMAQTADKAQDLRNIDTIKRDLAKAQVSKSLFGVSLSGAGSFSYQNDTDKLDKQSLLGQPPTQ